MIRNKFVKILIGIILVGAGVAGGYFWGFKTEQKVLDQKLNAIRPVRENSPAYKFVDPLLLYLILSATQD